MMKFNFQNQVILSFIVLFLFSCSVEENEIIELTNKTQSKEILLQKKSMEITKFLDPCEIELTVTACGYGVTVEINWDEEHCSTILGPMFCYKIVKTVMIGGYPSFVPVDSGMIGDGMTTPGVLDIDGCKDYTFLFWAEGCEGPPTYSVPFTSDGCYGVFFC